MALRASIRPWDGWPRCLHLENSACRLVATLDVGPRILHFGLLGGPNELAVLPRDRGRSGGRKYRFYGGHRLWYAPESKPYPLDNSPVNLRFSGAEARLTQAVEPESGLQKTMSLRLHPSQARLRIVHRLRNLGRRGRRLAPWALTVLRPGGEVLLPLPERGPFPQKLLPAGPLVLWPYTDLADRRWRFGKSLLRFRADPRSKAAQKLGLWSPRGWIAYMRGGHLLLVAAKPRPGFPYPDLGCNVETWGRGDMVEVETLGPLQDLPPGGSLTHVQIWDLSKVAEKLGDEAVNNVVSRRLKKAVF